ncbi:MAG: GNAT family N-acetyltransferase [Proteobacteria bacterium]|nr:GNAT family N-acetyltransferase [Pseudomonadota bacterium]
MAVSNPPPLQFRPVADFGAAARLDSARLTYESFPEFYDLLPVDDDERLAIIARQFDLPASELGATVAAELAGNVVAIFAALPAQRLATAQLVGVAVMRRALPPAAQPEFRAALDAWGGQVPLVPKDTVYLARLAVDAAHRGTGVADAVLAELFARHRSAAVSVHARRDNARALAFYRRHGFVPGPDNGAHYIALIRQSNSRHDSAAST